VARGLTVSPAAPPAGLVAAQRATISAAEELGRRIRPGTTERELAALADRLCREQGSSGTWTPIAVGAGSGNLVCHPDYPPTDRAVAEPDLVFADLTPIFGIWPADVTRSYVVGEDARRAALLGECSRIHEVILGACRPGMPASELFRYARSLLDEGGFELLDLLGNIGHDLGEGARVTGFIDPRNESPLWGCWAIEPHIGLDGIGAKLEDLVWCGPDGCAVVR
jgi:Xaa-Pro dipeptidase